MKFDKRHGSALRFWVGIKGHEEPFLQVHLNTPRTRNEDPELAAAYRQLMASPDMLTALEKFVEAYESASWAFSEKFRADEAYRIAKAVIAEATGQQSCAVCQLAEASEPTA